MFRGANIFRCRGAICRHPVYVNLCSTETDMICGVTVRERTGRREKLCMSELEIRRVLLEVVF